MNLTLVNTNDRIHLSIVIPIYNEADHLAEVISVIRGEMARHGFPYELLLIDDGSRDDTWPIICQQAQDSEVRGLRLSRNFGKEAALAAGLEAARGDGIIIMDGDLQHPPELIGDLLAPWLAGDADIVEAIKVERGREPLWQRFSALFFYRLLSALTGTELHGATDFKLLDRRVVDAWLQLGERNLFFRGMSSWLGFRRAEVQFRVAQRQGGESRWRPLQLFRLALTGITSFSSLPLQLTTFIGLIFLAFSVLLGGHTLYMKLSGQAVDGFTTVILLILIQGSFLLISIGIVGVYIARIYDEVKKRPRYLVAAHTGGPEIAGSGRDRRHSREHPLHAQQ